MQRKEPAGKGKTVQLGQNQLNSRKLKEKIEELKKLGVMITLWSFIIVIGNNKFNTIMMKEEEEMSSPSHSKIKEMRRIAERTEAPADKAELISYLNDRIKQA